MVRHQYVIVRDDTAPELCETHDLMVARLDEIGAFYPPWSFAANVKVYALTELDKELILA